MAHDKDLSASQSQVVVIPPITKQPIDPEAVEEGGKKVGKGSKVSSVGESSALNPFKDLGVGEPIKIHAESEAAKGEAGLDLPMNAVDLEEAAEASPATKFEKEAGIASAKEAILHLSKLVTEGSLLDSEVLANLVGKISAFQHVADISTPSWYDTEWSMQTNLRGGRYDLGHTLGFLNSYGMPLDEEEPIYRDDRNVPPSRFETSFFGDFESGKFEIKPYEFLDSPAKNIILLGVDAAAERFFARVCLSGHREDLEDIELKTNLQYDPRSEQKVEDVVKLLVVAHVHVLRSFQLVTKLPNPAKRVGKVENSSESRNSLLSRHGRRGDRESRDLFDSGQDLSDSSYGGF